jgi:hypothetical protein
MPSRRWVALLLLTSAAGLPACRETATAIRDQPEDSTPPVVPPAAPCHLTAGDLSPISFVRNPLLGCGRSVSVRLGQTPVSFTASQRSAVIGAIQSAVLTWNSVLGNPPVGLFRFDTLGSGGVVVDVESATPMVNCGETSAGTSHITLRATSCNGNYASLAELNTLLVHELAHVIGFDGAQWHSGASDSVRGNCASHLPASDRAKINGTVCALEMESIYYAYGIRPTPPNIRRHVISGLLGLPGSLTLAPQASTTVTIAGLKSDAPFCLGAGEDQASGGGCELPASDVSIGWKVEQGDLAVTPQGNPATLTAGASSGAGTLTARILSTGPHQLATFFQVPTVAITIATP